MASSKYKPYRKPDSSALTRNITASLFLLYTGLLTYIVFFSRRRQNLVWNDRLVNIIPIRRTLQSFSQIEETGLENIFANLFGNIFIFIPLAFFLVNIFGVYTKRSIIAIGFLLSFFIEFMQFILEIGVPDIDDILLNISGTIIGIYLYKALWSRLRSQPG